MSPAKACMLSNLIGTLSTMRQWFLNYYIYNYLLRRNDNKKIKMHKKNQSSLKNTVNKNIIIIFKKYYKYI